MKMKVLLAFILLISSAALGQKQVKIYYNKLWQVVSDASNADYYRIVNLDAHNKPSGIVRTYYITGELEWEGRLASMSHHNAEKDVAEGLCTWYYRNGKKSREVNLVDNKFDGLLTRWYENGTKYSEEDFRFDKRNGILVIYHENGKVKYKAEYRDNKLADGWVTECDEFERCQKVFREEFAKGENNYGWKEAGEKNLFSVRPVEGTGLVMENLGEKDIAEWVHVPIDPTFNFSIETIANFVNGQNGGGYGLVWGVMDWENYYYFYISANGYYKIGAVSDGLIHEFVKWKFSGLINKGAAQNLIKVNKVKNKVHFSINGKLVESQDFHPYRGNKVGFLTGGGNQVIYQKLIVRQDLYENEIDPIGLAYQGNLIKRPESAPAQTNDQNPEVSIDVERNIPIGKPRENAIGIIFGIEKYKSSSGVTFADRDAEYVKQYFTKTIGVPQENIYYKTDQNVTKAEFEKVFGEGGWLDNRCDTATEVFIYYVGHGVPSGDGNAYFMPYDCDPNYAHLAGYSVAKLYEDLGKLKAKNIVVILDACFVGQDRESNAFLADARSIGIKPKEVSPGDKIIVLSAASADQVSSGWPEKKHGLFTYYMMKGLQGAADKNQDKRITIGELGEYTTEKVVKQSGFIDRRQTPKLQAGNPDVVIYSGW